ncbi:hypothetical protein [Microbacterium excoecariae]|nr:hypothetical protein [Microbacterium excoecariae]
MIVAGIAFALLALAGLAATLFALPGDGYGLPRHGTDDRPHGR